MPFLSRLLAIFLAAACACAPAHADPLPIGTLHYGTTIDLTAGVAHFSLQFDRAPDLLTVDSVGRQADSFQFWTDTLSANPIQSTFDGISDTGPLGTQSVLAAVDIPVTGKMTFVWPQDASYTGPRDSGGWGIVEGQGAYALSADFTVAFDVPLSLLHTTDGHFYFGFETYQYGAWEGVDYFGEAGKDYWVGNVPEPSQAALLVGGVLALLIYTRRRRPPRR